MLQQSTPHGRQEDWPFIYHPVTGVQYVWNQWRQSEISPSTEAEDCTAKAQPTTFEERGRTAQTNSFWCAPEDGVRMTTSVLTPLLAISVPAPARKKRVLLVDASQTRRDLRADTMRQLGIDVDSAADISEARSWWRADLYNLVLINSENEVDYWEKFCTDVRSTTPPQQVAFLVGKPEYVANAPHLAEAQMAQRNSDSAVQDRPVPFPPGAIRESLPPLRWGILEASRQISAVRSLCAARTKAMRERPTPPRDLETRETKRLATGS